MIFNPNLIALYGQSNAKGQASTGLASDLTGALTGCKIWSIVDNAWQTLQVSVNNAQYPWNSDGSNSGVELRLMKLLQAHYGVDQYLMKFAIGGTHLASIAGNDNDWNVSSGANDLYAKSNTYATSAMAALDNKPPKAIVWIQGEEDTGSTTDANAYQQNLINFITAKRTFHGYNVPFIIVRLGSLQTGIGAFKSTVVSAQNTVGAMSNNYIVSADALATSDNIHYTAASYDTIAQRVYDAIISMDAVVTPPIIIKRKRIIVPQGGQSVTGQYPVDPVWLTSMNSPAYPFMDTLFQGNTTAPPPFYGALYNPFSIYHEFPAGTNFTLSQIDIGDYQSNLYFTDEQGIFHDFSFKIYGVLANGTETLLVTYDSADSYAREWHYPVTPTQYKKLRYEVTNGQFPNYIKLNGQYTALPQTTLPARTKYPIGNHTYVNFHIWNLMEDINNAAIRDTMYAPSYNLLKKLGGGRFYLDVKQIVDTEDDYRFNYTYNGYNVDALLESFAADNQHVVLCLKETPAWINSTYPDPNANYERVPIVYGANKKSLASYDRIAEVYFQVAARWGSNTNVNPSLVKSRSGQVFGGSPTPAWTKRIGMGVLKEIEVWNEVDKWWKGTESNLLGDELAYFLSAVYDRIKEANPTMIVSNPGLAYFSADIFQAFVEKCKEIRGYNNDGSVNIPVDNYQYHIYPNTADTQYSGQGSRGMCIELSSIPSTLDKFMKSNYIRLGNKSVECGETGYDWGGNSPLRAQPPSGSTYTAKEWAGILNLRITLWNAKNGVKRTFFFDWTDVNSSDTYGQFATSGITETSGTLPNLTISGRPSLNLLAQVRTLFKDYTHNTELSSSPLIDKWLNGSSVMYSAHMPTENGSTGTYNMPFTAGTSITLYTLNTGSTTPTTQNITTTGTFYTVAVSETPVFIKVN